MLLLDDPDAVHEFLHVVSRFVGADLYLDRAYFARSYPIVMNIVQLVFDELCSCFLSFWALKLAPLRTPAE